MKIEMFCSFLRWSRKVFMESDLNLKGQIITMLGGKCYILTNFQSRKGGRLMFFNFFNSMFLGAKLVFLSH